MEEILPAKNHSYVLGLKLGLPQHVVDGIHSRELKPEGYLLEVISGFLNEVGSRPTWRVIVDALRSPAVNLPQLAAQVKAAHFLDSIAIHKAVPDTPPTTGTVHIIVCLTQLHCPSQSLRNQPSLACKLVSIMCTCIIHGMSSVITYT